MNARIPVLLTSSVIAYDAGVSLKDPGERIRLTLDSVEQWLCIDPLLPIVLCDGSNFDFSPLIRERFPGATIECLYFENDQEKVRLHGRGYGEGEIVRHALDHPRLIAAAGSFAKCSAKLWVSNYQRCAAAWNGRLLCKGVFLDVFSPVKPTRLAYIDTRFYVASVAFYRQYLVDVHLAVRKQHQHGLEECFLAALRDQHLQRVLFPVMPVIDGVGGGTGVAYSNPLRRRFKDALRLWLVRHHPAYRDLFAG